MWYSMNAIGRHHDAAGSHRNQLQFYHQQQVMLLQQPCSVQIPCTFATPMISAGRTALTLPSLRQVVARNPTMMRACSSYTSVLKPSVQMLRPVLPSMQPFIAQQQAAMPTTMHTPVVQTPALRSPTQVTLRSLWSRHPGGPDTRAASAHAGDIAQPVVQTPRWSRHSCGPDTRAATLHSMGFRATRSGIRSG